MTSNAFNPLDIYRRYPEQNPYDLRPPIYNLVPIPDVDEVDTPQLHAAVLDIARRTGINVLATSYGTYPFLLGTADTKQLKKNPVSLSEYHPPPPLAKAELPESVEFVRQLNKKGNTPLFVVKVGGREQLLKVYPDVEIHRHKPKVIKPYEEDEPYDPILLFEREKEAYAHLVHAGICDQGYAPRCYGWVELNAAHVNAIAKIAPKLKFGDTSSYNIKNLQEAVGEGRVHRGILLEYFPNAQSISVQTVTNELAEIAHRSLWAIHSAYVRHGDLDGRNALIVSDERVVWIDFDHSQCASDPSLTRWDIFDEFHECWDMFYMQLLPNQRIGWSGHLEAPLY